MTDSGKSELLVRGITVAGADSQWTLLGTSEKEAADKVRASRGASSLLNAWSVAALECTSSVAVVVAHTVDSASTGRTKKARQVNGVSKALSPEYKEMFGKLSADFICVEGALLKAPSNRK